MKVKDLLEILENLDPEKEIVICFNDNSLPPMVEDIELQRLSKIGQANEYNLRQDRELRNGDILDTKHLLPEYFEEAEWVSSSHYKFIRPEEIETKIVYFLTEKREDD